jgi:hypothetical protein
MEKQVGKEKYEDLNQLCETVRTLAQSMGRNKERPDNQHEYFGQTGRTGSSNGALDFRLDKGPPSESACWPGIADRARARGFRRVTAYIFPTR